MKLNPLQTASLARDVYALTNYETLDGAYLFLNNTYKDAFAFTTNNLLKGKTGGPGPIKCQTAFGFKLIGKGKFDGHVFILFRGTQYLADWLTNINAIATRSACGELVHDGFNQAFLSMKPQLASFLGTIPKGKIKAIHCIGHSLGGAIATICAEWIAKSYGYKPFLYTYGSPRVGLQGFAEQCTKRLHAEKIFRVYHKTDVVPVIPTWPYYHTPYRGTDYYLNSPGILPGAQYHGMKEYVASVNRIGNDWGLLAAHKKEINTDASIARWLEDESFVTISVKTLDMLADALMFVLRKSVVGGLRSIEGAFTSSSTLIDKIAYVLSASIEIAKDISMWVLFLIQKMVYLLGNPKKIDASMLSREYIRNVLMSLQHKLNTYAKEALNQALVQGRAI